MNEQVECMSALVSSHVRLCLLTLILYQLGSLLGRRRDQGVTCEKNEKDHVVAHARSYSCHCL